MTYLGGPYYLWWLDNLADDVTGDGAAFQSPAQGAEAVRAIVLAARELYKHQEFSFIGDYDDRFLEEYTCQIPANQPAPSLSSPATPPRRLSRSWSTTGRAARYYSSLAQWARSSPALLLLKSSSP
jgi:hypothetical protein